MILSYKYEKPFMSITELVGLGLSKSYLNDLAKANGAPVVWTSGKGKIIFITSELDEFMKEVSKREKGRLVRR